MEAILTMEAWKFFFTRRYLLFLLLFVLGLFHDHLGLGSEGCPFPSLSLFRAGYFIGVADLCAHLGSLKTDAVCRHR